MDKECTAVGGKSLARAGDGSHRLGLAGVSLSADRLVVGLLDAVLLDVPCPGDRLVGIRCSWSLLTIAPSVLWIAHHKSRIGGADRDLEQQHQQDEDRDLEPVLRTRCPQAGTLNHAG